MLPCSHLGNSTYFLHFIGGGVVLTLKTLR